MESEDEDGAQMNLLRPRRPPRALQNPVNVPHNEADHLPYRPVVPDSAGISTPFVFTSGECIDSLVSMRLQISVEIDA
jgi:hypothetical protein